MKPTTQYIVAYMDIITISLTKLKNKSSIGKC